ncbi:helix-turn-helix domain-containing protein [Spirillospora sp. CA-128828]|uniref:helix-turn-helix domain-containing protein n=1 Tax=Spirillospora sp. CA-128828 TaxID=3240033 RepID=UPI003D90E68A
MGDQPRPFGAELRRARLAAGLSLGGLARIVHYSKGYLSKIETGRKPPGVDLARRCDAALGTGGRLSELVGPASPENATSGVAPPGDQTAEDEAWVMSLAPRGPGWFAPMSRRAALSTGAAALLTLEVNPSGGSAAMRQEPTYDTFAAMFELHRRLGRTMSPAAVLPSLIAQTHTLRELAAAARPPARNRLLLLAARYAEFTGWMAQEAGHDQAATWWTRTAVSMAEAAGDHEFAAHGLVRTALVAMLQEDAAQTVELAGLAQADTRVSPRVRGLAALREAQGHALAGDDRRCHRALDRAAALLDRAQSTGQDGGLALGPASVADMGPVVTGWCLYDLGRPAMAAQILDDQVPRMPAGAERARARFGARRALAHAAAGELDHACHLVGLVLDDIELVDSATIRVDLRRLSRTLTRWRDHAPVRELQPRLAAALHVPVR